DMVRSAQQQAFTPPNDVEPVTASLPDGALPETATVRGPPGSSLPTVIFADLTPKLVGWKRMGSGSEPPTSIVSGNDITFGTRNSGEEEVMLAIVRVQYPQLLNNMIWSV